jgi:hypothetical protein
MQGFYPLLFTVIFGILATILVKPWLEANRIAYNGAPIGYVTHAEGSVRRIHQKDITVIPSPTLKPFELRDGDELQTSFSSKADFTLGTTDKFEIQTGSAIKINYADPKNIHSAIYIKIMFGKLGYGGGARSPRAYVIQDGRLFWAGQSPAEKPLGLVISKTPQDPPETPKSENFKPHDRPAIPELIPQTLSNEYINSTIHDSRTHIANCLTEEVKKHPIEKLSLTTSFTIMQNGSITNFKMQDSSIQNKELEDCVKNVFAGIFFHPFSDPEIPIQFPISLE